MRKLLVLLLLLTALPAMAANWYVRKGATGTNAGTNWTNAWNEMSQINFSSVACGDTIWLAGGTYTTGIDQATTKNCTSSAPLNIYRVQSTDSVPVAAVGWSSSFDSQVVLTNINIEGPAAYITISGRIPSGILIQIPGTDGDGIDAGVHSYAATNIDHITWTYIEVYGPACVTAGNCTGGGVIGVNVMPFCANTATWTNLLYDHLIVHRTGEAFRGCGQSGGIVQYSTIYQTANDGQQHEDILYSNPPYENMTWRYNKIFMSPNDGIFFEGTPGDANFAFYGNMVYHSGGSLMTFKPESGSAVYGPSFIYNNVFENDNQYGDYQPGWLDFNNMASGSQTKNNVFENIQSDNGTAPPGADYNAYSNGSSITKDSGAHSFTYNPGTLGASTMFVNESPSNPIAADFHLTSTGKTTFANGVALSAPYNVDADGNTRGGSSWTIGAYQAVASTPTASINLTNTVLQPNPNKLGINIFSSYNDYQGDFDKNLLANGLNPGFEPQFASLLIPVASTGTTTTFQDPNPYSTTATGWWVGATATVIVSETNDGNAGQSRTISAFTAANGSSTNGQYTVSSAFPSAIAAGDIIQISQARFPTNTTDALAGNGVFNWPSVASGAVISGSTDVAADGGTQSIDMNATSGTASDTFYFDSQSGNIWTLLNGTYTIKIEAKKKSGTPVLTVSGPTRLGATHGAACSTQTFPASTTSWAYYTVSCAASEVDIASGNSSCVAGGTTSACTTPGNVQVTFSVTGGELLLDNASLTKNGGDSNNTTPYSDPFFHAAQAYCTGASFSGVPCMFRFWAGQNGNTFADLTAANSFVRRPTSAGYNNQAGYSRPQVSLGLPDFLAMCQKLNAIPYFVIPTMFKYTADYTELVQYLGDSGSSPGALIRKAQGQTAPWTSVFPIIHMSLGNENWNIAASGEGLPYRAAAATPITDYLAAAGPEVAAMQSATGYDSTKMDIILNSQNINYAPYLSNMAATGADSWENNGYTMGTTSAQSISTTLTDEEAEIYGTVTGNGSADDTNLGAAIQHTQSIATCGVGHNKQCQTNVYEMSTGPNGACSSAGCPTQTLQDQLTAGGYQWVDALHLMLLQHTYHLPAINFFGAGGFSAGGTNGTTMKLWGACMDFRDDGAPRCRPPWYGLTLSNSAIIGPEVSCPMTNQPTANYAGNSAIGINTPPGIGAIANNPQFMAFCFQDSTGSTHTMALYNVNQNAAYPVTFTGINPPSGTVTKAILQPTSTTVLNEASTGADTTNVPLATTTQTSTLTSFNPATGVTVPAGSMMVLTWNTGSTPVAPKGISGATNLSGKVAIQ